MNARSLRLVIADLALLIASTSSIAQTVSAPVGVPDTYEVDMNVTRIVDAPGVLENDEKVKGREGRDRSSLTAQLVSNVTNGNLLLNQDGSFAYTPGPDFVGSDAFTYFAEDGVAATSEVIVTLTISESATSAPVANDDAYTVDQDSTLDVIAPGILGNDQKVTGKEGRDRLDLSAQLLAGVSNGDLALSSDGAFTYLPNPTFVGDDSFTYNVYDNVAISGVATVTLTVTVTGVNKAPVASFTATPDNGQAPLLVNFDGGTSSDPDGNIVEWAWDFEGDSTFDVSNPAATSSFTYDTSGTFNATLRVTDDGGTTDTTVVSVTVTAVDIAAPVAKADSYATSQDTALTVSAPGVLGNDKKVVGKKGKGRAPLTAFVVNSTVNGNLLLNEDGSFDYMPDERFYGVDSFGYRAYDGTALSNEATVTISTNRVNSPPTISGTPDSIIAPDSQYVFVPDANDPEGDPLTFIASGIPSWANFDSTTGTLSGVPSETDIGVYLWIWIGVNDGQFTEWMNWFAINVVSETSTVVTLTWLPPTTNTDGSPLLDLSGFKIYYWDESVYPYALDSPVVDLNNPGLSAYVLEVPWAGFWKLAITAYNAEGTESNLSNILPIVAQ